MRFLERGRDATLFGAQPGRAELAFDDGREPVQAILDDEVAGAGAHGRHRMLLAARAGHHDERQFGIEALDQRTAPRRR